MRKFSIILLILINATFFAQTAAPQLINYQGVARDANGNPVVGPIGLRFHIHKTTAGGAIVFTEVHAPTTNAFGIFNVQIGSNNPSQFASITWGTDDYFLEVQMDPTGATSYSSIGSQQLVSVPYALYAKSAGNSVSYNAGSNVTFTGPANSPTINSNPNLSLSGNVLSISGSGSQVTLPSYLAGSNITVTPSGNNYIINAAASTATALPYTLTVNSPHNVTAGPSASLTIVAPNISVTGGGGTVTGNVLPNYSINIPTVVVTPTAGGLIFTQNGNTSTVAVGGNGQWTNTGPIVHLVTGSNNVGIGTTNSTAKLTVTTNIAIDAILAQSAGSNGILAQSISSATADAGVFGTNGGSGFGVRGEAIGTNTTVSGVQGINNGMGNGVMGITGSTNGMVSGVKGNNNNAGAGVYGENFNANASVDAHGVKGVTSNPAAQATGVTGINNSVGAGVYGVNTLSVNSANAHGVYGKTSNADVGAAGVYGINNGIGTGVYGQTGSPAINAYGVYGKSVGSGDGVRGETGSPNTTVAGVSGLNTGTGVALKASLPTASVVGSTNDALLIENGHIKVTSSLNAISNFSTNAPFAQVSSHGVIPNPLNNDVRGVVSYTTNQTSNAGAGGYIDFTTGFSKSYTGLVPTVIISPMVALPPSWQMFLFSVGNGNFVVRVINAGLASLPPQQVKFSYIVIE